MTTDAQFAAWCVAAGFLGYAIGATVQALVEAWFDQGWGGDWP